MVLWNLDLLREIFYYGKINGTLETTIVLYQKLWNFDLQRKKHGRLPKAM